MHWGLVWTGRFMKNNKWKRIFSVIILSFLLSSRVYALELVKTVIDENTVRLDYVDENGSIVRRPSQAYTSVIRTLDENGRALTDTYLDENGAPVPAAGGYYGITRIYNDQGQVSEYIYLDQEGVPTLIKYGYGILKRTYNEEKKADIDTYYDVAGNPVSLSRGQYGYRRIYRDGKVVETVYIDKNGQDMFFLDLFLHKHPWTVLTAMILLIIAGSAIGERGRTVLLFCYVLFILYMTLYGRENSEPHSNLELFWSYRKMFEAGKVSSQVVYNIVLFVPLGFLVFLLFSGKGWIIPFLLSVCVESLQYVTGTGLCEFDDVFNNTLGGLIGFGLAMIAVRLFPKTRDR